MQYFIYSREISTSNNAESTEVEEIGCEEGMILSREVVFTILFVRAIAYSWLFCCFALYIQLKNIYRMLNSIKYKLYIWYVYNYYLAHITYKANILSFRTLNLRFVHNGEMFAIQIYNYAYIMRHYRLTMKWS